MAPARLAKNFTPVDGSRLEAVRASLRRHYFSQPEHFFGKTPEEYLATKEGQYDEELHLTGRLAADRRRIVPWLDSLRPLRGSRILEIGCGTGASTVALCEQGADVTALDIDELAIECARERCQALGLEASFHLGNAAEVGELFAGSRFDFIIFFATLEHLTHAERIRSLAAAWKLLAPGELLCVVETPNRLSLLDSHTSSLPFFQWLPDDLALAYCDRSPRATLRNLDRGAEGAMTTFLRHGRGVSYHEFELAIRPAGQLQVVSDLASFLLSQDLVARLAHRFSFEAKCERMLRHVGPKIHAGFYQSWLDIAIRRD